VEELRAGGNDSAEDSVGVVAAVEGESEGKGRQ
jgi:hypothetical protein